MNRVQRFLHAVSPPALPRMASNGSGNAIQFNGLREGEGGGGSLSTLLLGNQN
ncbi:MAG: hypothetical protein RL392_955 [Pseudomonadota bacterium]|jgi:hypothetical protein